MENKKPYLSKTIILASLLSLFGIVHGLGFLPSVDVWMQAHQDLLLMVIGGVGVGLRTITSGKISFE